MKIIDLDLNQVYSFSWINEIIIYFRRELSKNYSKIVYDQMIEKLLLEFLFPPLYGNFVIKLNNNFYALDKFSIKKLSIDELLPIPRIKNEFLMNMYNRNEWKYCLLDITSFKESNIKSSDITIMEITEEDIVHFCEDTELEIISKILSNYLCGDILNDTIKKFEKLISMDEALPIHLIINKKHYFVYNIGNEELKLKERKISIENIENILESAFHGFYISQIQDIVTRLSNKIVFGIKEDYLIRVTEWMEEKDEYNDTDIKAIGLYFYNNTSYKFYMTFENYKKCWYSTPIPIDLIKSNKKFKYRYLFDNKLIKEFQNLEISGIALETEQGDTHLYSDGSITKFTKPLFPDEAEMKLHTVAIMEI